MPFPEYPMPMRIRIAPGADLTADPATYAWADATDDVSFAKSTPITLKVGQDDEEQQSLSQLEFAFRNHESRVAGGVVGRYTTDNAESDLWPDFDLNCPVEFAVDPLGTGWQILARQYLAEAQDEWPNNSAHLALTNVTANGLFRRLQQGADVKSALLRTHTAVNAIAPLVHYPLEEGTASTEPHSYPASLAGTVFNASSFQPGTATKLGGVPVLYGVSPLPPTGFTVTSSKFGLGVGLPIPDHTAGVEIITMQVRWDPYGDSLSPDGANSVDVNHRIDFIDGTNIRGRVQLQASKTFGDAVLCTIVDNVTDFQLGVPNDTLGGSLSIADGKWHEVQMRLVQSGADILFSCFLDGVQRGGTSTIAGRTLGKSLRVTLGTAGLYSTPTVVVAVPQAPFEVGHVTVHTDPATGQFYQATIGYAGEAAHTRIARLCAEEGVPYSVTATRSVLMGAQPLAALVPLLRECEKTDRGILDDAIGLARYRALSQIVNQSAAITIDAGDRQLFAPFRPVTDDAKVRNDVTATRPNGSVVRYVRTTGRRGTAKGRYTATVSPNVYLDDQLLSHASWRAWEGAVDGKRYPSLTLQLHAAPELVADWLAVVVGDRATITNPPRQHALGDVDLLLRGWAHLFVGRRQWKVVANCQNYAPYEVYVVETGSGNRSRIPAGVSTLAAGLSKLDASFSVTSATVPWIDSAGYAAMFPFDVIIGGEPMRVASIVGTGLTQTFNVVRSITGVVKTHAAGEAVQLLKAPVISL